MNESKEQLIENLKQQIAEKQSLLNDRRYIYAIQKTVEDIVGKQSPKYISGSTAITYDNIGSIVDLYSPYME
jgi:hypothetical protein